MTTLAQPRPTAFSVLLDKDKQQHQLGHEASPRPRSKSANPKKTTASGPEAELERASWREFNELLEHYVTVGRMHEPLRQHWTFSWTVEGSPLRVSTMSPIPEEAE